jgi:hypothetical protein
METLKLITRLFRKLGSKFVLGLIIASTLNLLPISTVLADRDDWDRHEGGWRGGDRDDWDRHRGYGNGYRVYQQPMYPQQPYGYAQPVYVPPPVQYLPPPSPGINLVVPLNFR